MQRLVAVITGPTVDETALVARAAKEGLSRILELPSDETGITEINSKGGYIHVIDTVSSSPLFTMAIGKMDGEDAGLCFSRVLKRQEGIETTKLTFYLDGLPGLWNKVLMIFIANRLGSLTCEEARGRAKQYNCLDFLDMIIL